LERAKTAAPTAGASEPAGGLDGHDREVAVEVGAGHLTGGGAPVGEHDGHLVASHVVGVGQDLSIGDDDAGPVPPAAADADDGRAGLGCDGPNCLFQLLQYAHPCLLCSIVTCNQQVTMDRPLMGADTMSP
jgi:hypothetical protein